MIHILETLQIKRGKLLSSLSFLLRCRDQNTVPDFLQLQHHIQMEVTKRIYSCTSFALLCEHIFTQWKLDETSYELLVTHILLAVELCDNKWALINCIIFERSSHIFLGQRQCNKLQNLHKA